MPSYDYRCPQCGKFTISQSIKEPALQECPTCGSPVKRLIGKNVNILYKCGGFYCKDTSSPNGTEPRKENNKTETKAEKKAEKKAETPKDSKAS